MTSVLKILESLDIEDGLEVSKLEKSLKLTKKLDKDHLLIAIKALKKLGLVQNIDENPSTPQQYGVRGIPTLLLFKNGEVVAEKVGALPKNQLSEWISHNIRYQYLWVGGFILQPTK